MIQRGVSGSALLRLEPSLKMEKRPGFHCCGIPNPSGLANCPNCGALGGAVTYHDADQVVLTEPLIASLLFKLADWLLNISKRIERLRDD